LKAKFNRSNPLRFCACNRNLIAKDTLVGATGMGDENRNDEGAGCWSLGGGGWSLVTGHWVLVAGCWDCEFGVWFVDPWSFFGLKQFLG